MFKRKEHRRTLACAAVLLMVLSVIPTSVFAASGDSLNYLVNPDLELEGASYFYEGLAAAKVNGKWGYMDVEGNMIIEAKYDVVNPFNEGKAIVATGSEDNYTVGIVDTSGKYSQIQFTGEEEQVLQPSNCRFHNGYAYIPYLPHYGGGTGILVNGSGNRVLADLDILGPYTDGVIHSGMVMIGGNYQTYVDINGNIVLQDPRSTNSNYKPEWSILSATNFQDGLAPAYGAEGDTYYDENAKLGFMDKNGEFVIEPQYENFYTRQLISSYQFINDGVISVQNSSGKWGGIDKTGKTVVPFEYDDGFLFSEGYARVKVGDKYGFVDTAGKLVIAAEYDGADDGFYEGLAAVSKNGKAGYINTAGEVVVPLTYDNVYRFVNGAAFVRLDNGKYGIVSNPVSDTQPVGANTPSSWAQEEIEAAEEAGLLTDSTNHSFRTNISRYQFIDLVVNMVEKTTEKSITAAPSSTFTDTRETAVLKGYAAGIVSGTSATRFSPDNQITREEMAAMLFRAIAFIEEENGESYMTRSTDLSKYSDQGQVSSWAKESVGTLVKNEIMAGTSDTTLSPKATATVEQSCLLVYRIYTNLNE